MNTRTFYAIRPESIGSKIYRFTSKRERDQFVMNTVHARPLPATDVSKLLKAHGHYVRMA